MSFSLVKDNAKVKHERFSRCTKGETMCKFKITCCSVLWWSEVAVVTDIGQYRFRPDRFTPNWPAQVRLVRPDLFRPRPLQANVAWTSFPEPPFPRTRLPRTPSLPVPPSLPDPSSARPPKKSRFFSLSCHWPRFKADVQPKCA